MALIRQADLGTAAREAVTLHLGDLARQAEALRQEATAQAQSIVAQAGRKRDQLLAGAREEGLKHGREAGYREGFAAGEQKGMEKALAEQRTRFEQIAQQWEKALAAFSAAREDMLLAARHDTVALAVAIAERVVKRTIETDPEIVSRQAAAVLALLSRPTRLQLRIHPADEPTLRVALPALLQRYTSAEHVEIGLDAALERGSCIARLAGGEIDASVATQFQRLIDAIAPAKVMPEGVIAVSEETATSARGVSTAAPAVSSQAPSPVPSAAMQHGLPPGANS